MPNFRCMHPNFPDGRYIYTSCCPARATPRMDQPQASTIELHECLKSTRARAALPQVPRRIKYRARRRICRPAVLRLRAPGTDQGLEDEARGCLAAFLRGRALGILQRKQRADVQDLVRPWAPEFGGRIGFRPRKRMSSFFLSTWGTQILYLFNQNRTPRSDSANLEPSESIFCPQILEPRYQPLSPASSPW